MRIDEITVEIEQQQQRLRDKQKRKRVFGVLSGLTSVGMVVSSGLAFTTSLQFEAIIALSLNISGFFSARTRVDALGYQVEKAKQQIRALERQQSMVRSKEAELSRGRQPEPTVPTRQDQGSPCDTTPEKVVDSDEHNTESDARQPAPNKGLRPY